MNIDKQNYNNTLVKEIQEENQKHLHEFDTHLMWHKVAAPYKLPEEKWMLDNAILDCKNHLVPWCTTGSAGLKTLWHQKRLKTVD